MARKEGKRMYRKRLTVELEREEESLPWLVREAAVRQRVSLRAWIVAAVREKLERERPDDQ
jgi:predicted HicB family RNase H-like nuclease